MPTPSPSPAVGPVGRQTTNGNKFRWRIANFTELTDGGCWSRRFPIGGTNWRVHIHPTGNANSVERMSMDVHYCNIASLPVGWSRKANIRFIVVNQTNDRDSRMMETKHEFVSGNIVCSILNTITLRELYDTAKGFLINDTVVIDVEFDIPEIEPIGEQSTTSDKFTWKIFNFSRPRARQYISQIFTIAGCDWKLLIFLGVKKKGYLSAYLGVANRSTLPEEWTMMASFSISVVNQNSRDGSLVKGTRKLFDSTEVISGFKSMMLLSKIRDPMEGYLLDDTLVVEVKFDLPEHETSDGSMSTMPVTRMMDSHFMRLKQLITKEETSIREVGCSIRSPAAAAISKIPKKEEVEKAKQSLKECLSDIYKLNMKDRMADALSTLSAARGGLSVDQRKVVKSFWANFGEYTSDLLAFDQDNSEFELQKLAKDQTFAAMKKSHQAHLLKKKRWKELNKEEEELKRKLAGVESKRQKLISDWEILHAESLEEKSQYEILEKKVAKAEGKKRIAEERMSRSTTAWSELKARFG